MGGAGTESASGCSRGPGLGHQEWGGGGTAEPTGHLFPRFSGVRRPGCFDRTLPGGGGVDRHIGGNPFKIKAVTLVGSLAGLERHQCH